MTALIAFWLAIAVVAVIGATLREIYTDGRGHTPPPRSHEEDPFFANPSLR